MRFLKPVYVALISIGIFVGYSSNLCAAKAKAAPVPSLENWMGDYSAYIENKPISQITLPGTHDSATDKIKATSKIAPGQDISSKLNTLRYTGVGLIVTGIIAKWSKAQSRNSN